MNWESHNKKIALVGSSFCLFLNLFYIFCWYAGFYSVLSYPTPPPISYLSALNGVMTSLAILSLYRESCLRYIPFFGLFIIFISFSRILEILEFKDFALTHWLIPSLPHIYEIHLSAIGATVYFLIGMILCMWRPYKRVAWESAFQFLLSEIVIALGCIGVLSFFVPLNLNWPTANTLSFYGSLNAIILGISLLASCSYFDIKLQAPIKNILPKLVAITLAFTTLLFLWSLESHKTRELKQNIQSKLVDIQKKLTSEIKKNLILIRQLSDKIALDKNHALEAKELDLPLYFKMHRELLAVVWLDSNLMVRNHIFKDGHQGILNRRLHADDLEKTALFEAAAKAQSYFLVVEDPSSKRQNLWLIHPVYQTNELAGFMVFILSLDTLFAEILGNQQQYYALTASLGNQQVYPSFTPSGNIKDWEVQDILPLKNLKLLLTLGPTQKLFNSYINKTLTLLTLLGGLILSIGAGILIHIWQQEKKKLLEMESFKKQLLLAEEEQNAALDAVKMGTWEWNVKNNSVKWHTSTYELFGVKTYDTITSYDDFLKKVYPRDLERIKSYLKMCVETHTPIDLTYRVIWPDGSVHWLISKGKFFTNEQGQSEKMRGFSWEVTDTKRAMEWLEISETISKILSETHPIPTTFQKIVNVLKYYLEWSVMLVWTLDRKNEELKLLEVAHSPEIQIPEFKKASYRRENSNEILISERVKTILRPIWFTDITDQSGFKRVKEATEEGLKGCLAFPILEGSRLIGVVELFRQTPFNERVSEGLLNLFTSLGIGIGQYLNRLSSEEELAELAAIVTNANDGIYSTTLDGIIKSWNKGAEKIFGWKAQEMIGKPITIIYPDDYLPIHEKLLKNILSGQTVDHIKMQNLKKDGSLIWVDKAKAGIKNLQGEIIAIATIVQDVSKEIEILDALSESERKFRDFVESTDEWIWEINENFNFTYSNPSVYNILGYLPEEIIGQSIFSFVMDTEKNRLENKLHESIHEKLGWKNFNMNWKHKDNFLRIIESNAIPIINDNGVVVGFRGVDQDVTEQRMMEKTKNEFISIVSHELRTPLTSIQGSLGLLRHEMQENTKQKDLLEIAYRNSERLINLINDILDIQKFALGKYEFFIEKISIQDLIQESIHLAMPMAEKFGISIVIEGKMIQEKFFADRKRTIQVMMNLLSNAIKFSPAKGTVFISSTVKNDKVRILIKDQGPGISEDFKNKIFEKFAQADSSSTRRFSGTGLGLNICKTIIEQMGGHIDFISKLGEGSTFYFELPCVKEGSHA